MERQPDSILYIETDIPAGMTSSEYRRSRPRRSARKRYASLPILKILVPQSGHTP
jgi:hypothetical protein